MIDVEEQKKPADDDNPYKMPGLIDPNDLINEMEQIDSHDFKKPVLGKRQSS